jgi:uncharacterized protein YegP (UPF0339 family)
MKSARFVVFQDKKKQWRWHLKAGNGRIIAQGEAHSRKADAQRAINAVRKAVHSIFPAWAIRRVYVNTADLKEKWDGL